MNLARPWSFRRLRVLGLAFILLAGTVLAGPAASASSASPPVERIAQTWGVNGRVLDVLTMGNLVVVAGKFTAVTGVDGQSVPAGGVAIYDATTGTFTNTNFSFDKQVTSVSVNGDTLYAVGKFRKVGGKRSKFVAAVSLTTGALVPGFSVSVDKAPSVVRYLGGQLYLGGAFTTVTDSSGTHARANVARVSATTGAWDSTFAPSLNAGVTAIEPAADGASVYVGGDFTTVNGSGVYSRVARLSTTTGLPSPAFSVGATNQGSRAPIRSMALSGSTLALGTTGSGGACALVDAASGAVLWSRHANGDVTSVGFKASNVYCGGHFSGSGAFDGLTRKKLAAVEAATGNVLPWAPSVNSALGVFALDTSADALFIGGDFTVVGPINQSHFGQFRAADAVIPPAAVAQPTALAGNGQVTVSWPSPSTDGGSALLPYRVMRAQGGGAPSQVGETSSRSFTDTTVTNGVTYTYTIIARSGAGLAPASPGVTATPIAGGLTVPAAPAGLTASGVAGAAQLAWTAPSNDGGAPVTSYRIYRRVADGASALHATVPATPTSYVDTDVEVGTRYYYSVRAVNQVGEGPASAEASATPNTGVPSPPTLSLTSNTASGVALSWTVPFSPAPITKYVLVRDNVKITEPSASMTSFTDTTVVSGQSYTYKVRAVNAYGTSKWSNSIVVTVP